MTALRYMSTGRRGRHGLGTAQPGCRHSFHILSHELLCAKESSRSSCLVYSFVLFCSLLPGVFCLSLSVSRSLSLSLALISCQLASLSLCLCMCEWLLFSGWFHVGHIKVADLEPDAPGGG